MSEKSFLHGTKGYDELYEASVEEASSFHTLSVLKVQEAKAELPDADREAQEELAMKKITEAVRLMFPIAGPTTYLIDTFIIPNIHEVIRAIFDYFDGDQNEPNQA